MSKVSSGIPKAFLISLATAGLAANKEVPESMIAESREIP
jgi:hypothetical protein